ncbi:hypothetical protein C8N25_105178 [Algoriphagus antarcticus]|uniref:Uncharacterized protein n=1 Tax=Algoriphagus antarcticus TaxID=238540 RepID=A0A3E0E2A0_9BACT|nr:hypothetical protein C8N25_105178 [Algoriphagus antarcticus]
MHKFFPETIFQMSRVIQCSPHSFSLEVYFTSKTICDGTSLFFGQLYGIFKFILMKFWNIPNLTKTKI